MNPNIIRKEINKIDLALIKLLKQRFYLAGKIGKIKKDNHLPILDLKKENKIIKRVKTISRKCGLNPNFTTELFNLIFIESKKVQEKHD